MVFIRSRAQLGETLSVRDDFAQIQSTANFLNELRFIACTLRLRSGKDFRSSHTLIFKRRDVACEYRFSDKWQRFAEVKRALAGPFTGTFVCRLIEDHVDQVFALFIFFGEDVFSDVNEIAAKLTFIPFGKGLRQLFIRKRQTTFQ